MESRVMSSELWNAVAVVVVTVIGYQILNKVLWRGIWTPLRLRRIMVKQGVRGPPFRFPFGQVLEFVTFMNSFPEVVPLDSYADLSPTVTPQYALYYPQFPGANPSQTCVVEFCVSVYVCFDPELERIEFMSLFGDGEAQGRSIFCIGGGRPRAFVCETRRLRKRFSSTTMHT